MNHTEYLQAWQDNSQAHDTPVGVGAATKVWLAAVVTVNPDGTVDAQPVGSRGTKTRVPIPDNYVPEVGDTVAMVYLGGNHQYPQVIGPMARVTIPAVTGSKGDTADGAQIPALNSLLSVLADLKLILDHTS